MPSAMRPVIGIPLCLDDRGRWRSGRDYVYADLAYAHAVRTAGATAVHLPPEPSRSEDELRERLASLDGLLLPGGDDFPPDPSHHDPARYPDEAFDLASPAQVASDRQLLEAALADDLPLLGICYGMQLLALAAGGTLHPHLPIDLPADVAHGGGSRGTTRHPVQWRAGSRLAGVAAGAATVNSRHHQGVRDAGELAVAALAPDGLIEAIESSRHRFVVGVQWHPETLEGAAGAGVIEAFVGAARTRRAERGARGVD